ncbi:type VI secretion system accessory protein TagJ [Burkholderia plantarii]|uniref:type VI secretion system accessory protein TagJ n=1 Tax=Burkholderia plantarii TaxID=41899 RepID=UPI0029C76CC0|nr:type VI secretion system accessory protein TagJ [Burkholderia plantarii]
MNLSFAVETLSGHRLGDLPTIVQIERIESSIRVQPTFAVHRWAFLGTVSAGAGGRRYRARLHAYPLPGSEAATDVLRLGRETAWQESGRTAVIAPGRKTRTTDQGDFSPFELDHAQFGSRITGGATPGEPADD